ncbi:MAG: T9SS type A sorting domain-containing protein [Calditrichia bacterium]
MKKLTTTLFCLSISLLSYTSVFAQTSLNFGQTNNSAISTLGEVDSYTFDFTGTFSETVIIRMAEPTSTTFSCLVKVFGPNGIELANVANNLSAEVILTNLSNGTYTITAEENGGNATGPYSLFVQRSKDAGNPIALDFGVNGTYSLPGYGDVDTYTFDITEGIGQSVIVRMSDLPNTSFYPTMRIFSPSGQQIGFEGTPTCAEFTFNVVELGTYTIWAYEGGGDQTGAYGMVVQKSLNAGSSSPLAFGDNSSNTIAAFGQVDTYTFDITEGIGQSVIIRMTDLPNTSFYPTMHIFSPDGQQIGFEGSPTCSEFIFTVVDTGQYTIWSYEGGGDQTGAYGMVVQKSLNAGNTAAVAFGENGSSTVATFGQIDSYTFDITEGVGQSVIIRMSDLPNTSFYPTMRIFSPSGQQISFSGAPTCAEFIFNVVELGTYTIWAYEGGGDQVGAYALLVQTSLNAGSSSMLSFGENSSHTVAAFGEVDTYTFDVSEGIGQSVIIRMSDLPNTSFYPTMRIFSPNGQQIDFSGAPTCAEFIFTVVDTGQYTIWAYEGGGDQTGAYGMLVQTSLNAGNTTSAAFGNNSSSTIATFGQVDSYTFDILDGVGQSAIIRMSDLPNTSFYPNFRIFNPNGQQIGFVGSPICAEFVFNVVELGTYTIWAYESGGDQTGAYGMVVQKSYQPGEAIEIFQGTMITETIATFGQLKTFDFYFPGPVGGTVDLQMMEIQSSSFASQLTLFAPDGQQLADVVGVTIADIVAVLPDTGRYAVWARESGGDVTGVFELSLDLPLGIGDDVEEPVQALPTEFALRQNYPNPFNPTTSIAFALPRSEAVNISVLNINGQLVRTLISNVNFVAGEHVIEWDARDDRGGAVSSGVYFYRIHTADFSSVRRMILLR